MHPRAADGLPRGPGHPATGQRARRTPTPAAGKRTTRSGCDRRCCSEAQNLTTRSATRWSSFSWRSTSRHRSSYRGAGVTSLASTGVRIDPRTRQLQLRRRLSHLIHRTTVDASCDRRNSVMTGGDGGAGAVGTKHPRSPTPSWAPGWPLTGLHGVMGRGRGSAAASVWPGSGPGLASNTRRCR
jgi:hypothetical protein